MTASKIFDQAMKLPQKERTGLARALLHSSSDDEEDDFVLTAELKAELEEALKECDEHPERLISWEEIKRELHSEFKK